MKREHLVEKDWDGPGVYLCKCGASLQAVNRDVLNWIFLDHCAEQAAKQARAEVLAAVSKHRLDMDEGLCACGWESKGETWAEHILALQPAAKDLEALLQEARQPLLDVLREAPSPVNISSPQGQVLELDNAMFHKAYFDWYRKRIAELEKARAISEETKHGTP